MDNIIERIADFADIDTRRAMGFPPRKLVVPNLPILFAFHSAHFEDPRYFNMEFHFGDDVHLSKMAAPSMTDKNYLYLSYHWFHKGRHYGKVVT